MRQIYDVIVIGAGPAGMFAADHLSRSNKDLKVLVVDEHKYVGGAGALTDCKLNLNPYIGMDMQELGISEDYANEIISYIDRVFLKHGADKRITGTNEEEIRRWVDKAASLDMELVPALQRHTGTDKAFKVMWSFKEELEQRKVEFLLETRVEEILNDTFDLRVRGNEIYHSQFLLPAIGRRKIFWFREQANRFGFRYTYGPLHAGIRVETLKEVTAPLTDIIYDPKIKYVTKKRRDKVRTFCTNPGGKVRIEPKEPPDVDFVLVNGDALKRKKTPNTNFAILETISLKEPYEDTTEMARSIAKETNRLGGGKPIIQRLGDYLNGSRSHIDTFNMSNYDSVKPTLKPGINVVPGDISLAYRARNWENLIEFLDVLDQLLPGIIHSSTILYAPEIKFSDVYQTDQWLETNVPRLFVAGDGAGKSRGIVGAALTGIMAAQGILNKL